MNKIVNIIATPFRWILNRIHLFLFVTFLNNRKNVIGGLLFYVLPKSYYDTITAELHVPSLWLKRIFNEVRYKSSIYGETRHEKLIKVPKAPIYPASMHIPSSDGEELNTFKPSSSLYGNLITINDVVIDHAIKRTPYGLNHELIEYYSTNIANNIDKQIFARFEPSSFTKNLMINGIFHNKHVISRISSDHHTIGGYIPTKIGSPLSKDATADDIKEALFHMPQGYRPRAKWYTNQDIGLEISTMKIGTDYLINQRDDSLRTAGVPDRLLNKPIIYSSSFMTNLSGYPVMMIADLSHAYTIVEPVSAILSFNNSNSSIYYEKDKYSLVFKIGGDIVHPEAIKVLKSEIKVSNEINKETLVNIETNEVIENE